VKIPRRTVSVSVSALGAAAVIVGVCNLSSAAGELPPAPGAPAASQTIHDNAPGLGCGWLWPLDSPVVDPFRPPAHPYGPGNRGLEFGPSMNLPVRAVADGRTGFVGSVAGKHYVVVHHRNQVRSTVGPMERVDVQSGQEVRSGQRLGLAAEGLHLTARIRDEYVDPMLMLDGGCVAFRLIS